GALQRDAPAAQLEAALDVADVRRGEEGQVGAPIPVQKIENVVLRGVRPGAERGPGYGRDRGEGRLQGEVAPALGQLPEPGQLSLGEKGRGEVRIVPVETDDDQSPDPALRGLPATQDPPERPEGPDEEGDDRQDDRREQDQERGDECEPGAGADVG